MPTVGTRELRTPGTGYAHDPMNAFAKEFATISNSILQEQQLDVFTESTKVLRNPLTDGTMRDFFVENSCDKAGMTAEELEDHYQMMNGWIQICLKVRGKLQGVIMNANRR